MTHNDRPPVRSQAYDVPREFAGKFKCALCEAPLAGEVFAVHVDKNRNDKGEIKAETHGACSAKCRDRLMHSLAVEYALTGVTPLREEADEDGEAED